MTTIYSGNPGNVSNSLTRSITGAANNGAGLIRITTSGSHLYASFDVVIITGVGGTTEANGTWSITVISSTTFDLVGSTFTNAYTSGGSVTDRSLTPAATLPSDGEPITVTSIIASVQVCLDRTQFLATRPVTPAVVVTVPPTPFNLSYGADWLIGDDGTGTSTGHLLVKAVPNDNGLFIELTQFLVGYAGRRLASCNPVFAVGQSHSGIPLVLPTAGIYKSQSLTTLSVAPAALVSLIAAGPTAFPTPVSAAAYYDIGHLQSWTVAADQDNVIDASARYFAVLIDESSTNSMALNKYYGFRLTVN